MKKTLKDIVPRLRHPTLVNLTVHRNNRAQRAAKECRRELLSCARELSNTKDLVGFAIVIWDKDWGHRTKWCSGDVMPGNALPEYIKNALLRDMATGDVKNLLGEPQDDEA